MEESETFADQVEEVGPRPKPTARSVGATGGNQAADANNTPEATRGTPKEPPAARSDVQQSQEQEGTEQERKLGWDEVAARIALVVLAFLACVGFLARISQGLADKEAALFLLSAGVLLLLPKVTELQWGDWKVKLRELKREAEKAKQVAVSAKGQLEEAERRVTKVEVLADESKQLADALITSVPRPALARSTKAKRSERPKSERGRASAEPVEGRTLAEIVPATSPEIEPERDDVVEESRVQVAPGADPDDPHRGQFGGLPAVNGRRLTATFALINGRDDLVRITLRVEGDAGFPALSGHVRFFLHPTYPNNEIAVRVEAGVAVLPLVGWGAFTVGAECEDNTRLELNLAVVPGVPSAFAGR